MCSDDVTGPSWHMRYNIGCPVWETTVVGCWRLAAVGGWRLVAVGGWWELAVGGWWSLGAVLMGGP